MIVFSIKSLFIFTLMCGVKYIQIFIFLWNRHFTCLANATDSHIIGSGICRLYT